MIGLQKSGDFFVYAEIQDLQSLNNPGMMIPPTARRKFAQGGEVVVVPGSGNSDSVPAMLTPGETVIPKAMSKTLERN